jgi:hypothetical protein
MSVMTLTSVMSVFFMTDMFCPLLPDYLHVHDSLMSMTTLVLSRVSLMVVMTVMSLISMKTSIGLDPMNGDVFGVQDGLDRDFKCS